jgi:hypothetical protein
MFEKQLQMQYQNFMRESFELLIDNYLFFEFSLDPELKDELILIITKLLADKTIVSSARKGNFQRKMKSKFS